MTETSNEYCTDAGASVRRDQPRLSCLDGGAVAEELTLEQPDLETLMQWEAEGGCEAACPEGCWVEPDGTCPHGHPSWLLVMGLV